MAATTMKLVADMDVNLLVRMSKVVVKDSHTLMKEKKDGTKTLKKKEVISAIMKEIERNGVKRLSDALNIADAQAICDTLEVEWKDSNRNMKNVCSKRLRNIVRDDGLEETLAKLEADQQTACLEALECADKSGTAKGIATRIAAEVRRVGAEVVLSKMDMAFLKDLGEGEGLKNVDDVSSQPKLIKAILTGKMPAKRPRVEPKVEKISKKKPALESGITLADMMQHYNLTELQDFARDNSLVISGKKKEVMKRIHEFFEKEEEPVAKKTKKDTKKEAPKPKKGKKTEEVEEEAEEETKPATPKKTKKGKKTEEVEEAAEEEEEEVVAEESPKDKKAKKGKKEVVEEAAEEEEEEEAKPVTPKKGSTPKKGKKVVGER